nr:tRNA (guanine(9)-N1)-methyltransferase [Ipomoea batatas]
METESDSDDNKSPPPATAASPPPATAASPPPATTAPDQQPPLSKRAQKKLLKQQRFEAKKAEKKAQLKEHKQREAERKRREWAERLAGMSEEEKLKLIEERKSVRRERMEKRSEEKGKKIERLTRAKESGQNFVIDLEFSDLMTSNELQSLVQQIMYCYAMNGRCETPAHLWLAGYQGEMQNLLEKTPGYDKWLIEKESRPYIEAFQDQKENLVYLTADSENVLDELDPKKVYIIGGLVDRNRWKGITMNKAKEQGIQTAKLPIGNYLKMSSSQVNHASRKIVNIAYSGCSLVLTVNQVVEILLKFLELRDWKASFFEVIPQRKRCEADSEDVHDEPEGEDNAQEQGDDHQDMKRQCIEGKPLSNPV